MPVFGRHDQQMSVSFCRLGSFYSYCPMAVWIAWQPGWPRRERIAVQVAVSVDDNAVSGIRISKSKRKRFVFSRIVDYMPQSTGSGEEETMNKMRASKEVGA